MTPERLTQIRQRVDLRESTGYSYSPLETVEADRKDLLAFHDTEQTMHAAWQKRAEEVENEVERLFKESENVREDLDAKWEAAQARADRLEQQLAHQSEHLSDCVTSESALSQDLDKVCGRVRQAEAQLATLKDKLKEWDVVGLLNTYACTATANKLAALLAALEIGSESK